MKKSAVFFRKLWLSFTRRPKVFGRTFREQYRSVIGPLNQYLSIFALLVLPIFIYEWGNEYWLAPWALTNWIGFIVFNAVWNAYSYFKGNPFRREIIRAVVNVLLLISLFYLTGGIKGGFWFGFAVCATGMTINAYFISRNPWLSNGILFVVLGILLFLTDIGRASSQDMIRFMYPMVFVAFVSLFLLKAMQVLVTLGRELKDMEEEQKEIVAERKVAEAENKAKSRFLAHMSHEIRTPLSVVLGFIGLLQKEELSKSETETYLQTIERNAKHLLRLIEEILDLSKIEAGELAVDHAPCSLVPEITNTILPFQLKAKEKGIKFSLVYETSVPEMILTDVVRFRQIMINIVGNALKFTKRGSITVNIGFDQRDEQEEPAKLTLVIEDTGCGISPEVQTKLFRPFEQGGVKTSGRYGGTGLGLILSRRLAQAMGGDVVLVRSQKDKGSTFEITIECNPVNETEMIQILPKSLGESSLTRTRAKLEGVRVLLVEDSVDCQRLFKNVLKLEGAEVDAVGDGVAGVSKAGKQKYDAILMDLQLPRLDGYAATEQIRKEGYKGPIIALTANATTEDKKRSLASGCSEFCSKPIEAKRLVEVVSENVG